MSPRRRKERPLTGTVSVPGDKSISHRAVILGALSRGTSTIDHPNLGLDVRATMRAVEQLGARVAVTDHEARVVVEGSGWDGLHEPSETIDVGNSGTTIRTLLGVCASVPGLTVLTGDASIRSRPMLRVVAPLRQMGATIDGRDHGDKAPLSVRGAELKGIDYEMPVASAQVKTALLLAGLRANGTTEVIEPRATRDHTERMLTAAGVPVARDGLRIALEGPAEPAASHRVVPGDLSSAMFLIAAALMVPGSDLTIEGVGLNPTRTAALDVLRDMGATLEVVPGDEAGGEPVGTVRACYSELKGVELDPDSVPGLIDEIPALSVIASQAEGTTVIRGAGELRVKESDRIESMAAGLRTLGVAVETLPDGLVITGPTPLTGGAVDSQHDHRVAMAFACAGLVASENVRVEGWSAVNTSFPEFLDLVGQAQAARR